MDHKILQKVPPSAISLYAHLYCKTKNSTKTKYYNNLVEATKSWLTLTEEEKLKFVQKLEECRSIYHSRFAEYLKNAEPYLKKKQHKSITVEQELREQNVTELSPEESNHRSNDQWVDNLMDTVDTHDTTVSEDYVGEALPEPIPPAALCAKDLFNIVADVEGNHKQKWNSLPVVEARRYGRAAYKLKRDYLANYKAYLESLPSEKLFEYYQNTINS